MATDRISNGQDYWLDRHKCIVRVTDADLELTRYRPMTQAKHNATKFERDSMSTTRFMADALLVPLPLRIEVRNHIVDYRVPSNGDIYITGTGRNMYVKHKSSEMADMRGTMGHKRLIVDRNAVTIERKRPHLKQNIQNIPKGREVMVGIGDGIDGPCPRAVSRFIGFDVMSNHPPCENLSIQVDKAREGSDCTAVMFMSDMHMGHMHKIKTEAEKMLQVKLSIVKAKLEAARALRIKTAEELVAVNETGPVQKLKDYLNDVDRVPRDVMILAGMPPALTDKYDKALDLIDSAAAESATAEELGFDYQKLVSNATNLDEYMEPVPIGRR